MANLADHYNLSDEQLVAVSRFRKLHKNVPDDCANDGHETLAHQLSWAIDDELGGMVLACTCGVTLRVSEPIFVSVKPEASKREGAKPLERARDEIASQTLAAVESLYQSALVTLSDETFEQIRLHPSTVDMHFGLGMYLRNRFVHSGLLHFGVMHPDSLSSDALSKLVRYCLPELAQYDLVFNRLEYGVLYDAYRYCMEVRGEFPKEELTAHYDILVEAKAIDDANPYSALDSDHCDERIAWSNRCKAKEREYDALTLRAIWDFERVRADCGAEIGDACEALCLAAANGGGCSFVPSEIAYVLAGSRDKAAMRAFDWAVKDYGAANCLPDSLFEQRDLVLRAVRLSGWLLERAAAYQDDEEVVLAAVANNPDVIACASPRLQQDERVLAAVANAEEE